MSSRPLRLGIVGLGRAFSLMLPTFLRDERIVLAGACDPRPAARAQFARDFSAPVYDDIPALAADPALDALYIASPHQFHARHTEIAAAHGKHVLVEKPMALAMEECDRMIAACERAGVHLIVGHCHSFDMPYLKTRELIDSGEFGRVRMIHALNYTDYLYRPRRPEELVTAEGGGAIFSQAAHQVDIVRLLAGARPVRLRAAVGNWDPRRATEGAYSTMLWFDSGAYASLSYNGYGHFDSDEWTGWIGEMGQRKSPDDYGAARRKLAAVASPEAEAQAKADATYGGAAYQPPAGDGPLPHYQHFGPIIVSCEHADLRPLPEGIAIYADDARRWHPLDPPAVPRHEVLDELVRAVHVGTRPRHDGHWAKATLEICLAMLASAQANADVALQHQPA
ncbi:MAG: Gfo/Idh/MocA family oxidoreductase [Pigmentiphaga sp.]|uniref:Gfo/Idh/MocA family protein n=1 Tax=Pigmentiphaga sp. TaxID=1977564 RepID=UPI0029BD33C6|nr:Gfo/Idh/MocA family oxidoreductase [Pigmentiphaga sp.]MDX3907025.1 Gfo/Idh/MocA family oxidoreductase [Pigmentiphaga sp.]